MTLINQVPNSYQYRDHINHLPVRIWVTHWTILATHKCVTTPGLRNTGLGYHKSSANKATHFFIFFKSKSKLPPRLFLLPKITLSIKFLLRTLFEHLALLKLQTTKNGLQKRLGYFVVHIDNFLEHFDFRKTQF